MVKNIEAIKLRIMRRIDKDQKPGCWIWIGARNGNGYGTIKVRCISMLAHRISYEVFRGPIDRGRVVDHLCRVPACVNPDHLDVTTQRVNNLRSFNVSAFNARKVRCNAGHALVDKYEPGKKRRCPECHNQRNAEYRARLRITRGL